MIYLKIITSIIKQKIIKSEKKKKIQQEGGTAVTELFPGPV